MARKKYHQSFKDRMDEHEGMERNKRREFGSDGMISEDHNAPANLPQQPVHKQYARYPYGLNGPINDTLSGVDEQIYDDLKDVHKFKAKSKF